MDFSESARKHSIPEADVLHAIRNAMTYQLQHCDAEVRMLVLGPDRQGRLLEIVVVPASEPHRVIHAVVMRPKFYDLLRGVR